MTDTQRGAVTLAIRTYIRFNDEYKDKFMLDNGHIATALKKMFTDNIVTAEELSREIKSVMRINVSARMLKYMADGRFISVTNGGKISRQSNRATLYGVFIPTIGKLPV